MFLEEELSQAGQKTTKALVKHHFTQTHLTDLNIEKTVRVNCLLKCSWKEKSGKADAY